MSGQEQAQTPAAAAQHEAARQAVGLVFTVAGVLILMPLYRKIAQQQANQMRAALQRIDPVMARIQDEEAARDARARRARYWQRVAGVLWPVSSAAAVWALRRAESVSKAPAGGEV